MALTRKGISYDLKSSPYTITTCGQTLHFSSALHIKKFEDKQEVNRSMVNYSLSHRFGFSVKMDILADISLYSKIESRGFFITNKEGNDIWQNQFLLSGEALTLLPCERQ